MSYSKPFLRLVVIGTIYRAETFSYSMSLIEPGLPTSDAPEEVPAGIIAAVRKFHTTPALISKEARLTTIKLNMIGTDGRYMNDETVLYDFPEPSGVDGASESFVVPQVAFAVSLRTNRTRGRAHAGRFYVPLPNLVPGLNGQLPNTELVKINPAVTEFLNEINLAAPPWRVGVTSDLGVGAQNFVTNARLGRVLDTIRSRRTSLDEDYVDLDPLGFPVE